MVEHVLRREQWLPRPIDEVFEFFSDARNLEAITPPWLGFRILATGPIEMKAGTRIRYRIRLRGLPMGWLTEIQEWDPPRQFVDVQLRGPYKLWRHTHRFESVDGGTMVHDEVRYALGFGPIGRLVHAWTVRRDVETIFDYRARRMEELFGNGSARE
ncbi:SRPBCC family protein [Paludisphaera sp.]|uniref:SRPBCC family protein n=1 Tax=Paludisphaera sp. TaxID=2017432 RepID=UPI00301D3008